MREILKNFQARVTLAPKESEPRNRQRVSVPTPKECPQRLKPH
jgi:hypothetical protein